MSVQCTLGGGFVVALCTCLIPGLVVDTLLVLVQMRLDSGAVITARTSKLTDLLVHAFDVPVQGVRRRVRLATNLANPLAHSDSPQQIKMRSN